MAKLVNRAKMSVSGAPGTGPITLGTAASGFMSFAVAGVSDGDIIAYVVEDASNTWEIGYGTYSATGPTLTRTTITASSNSNAAINATSAAVVFVAPLAADLQTAAFLPIAAAQSGIAPQVFASAANLLDPRNEASSTGTDTAAIIASGYASSTSFVATAELYDGTAWALGPGALSATRSRTGSAGTQTAALCFGGYNGATPYMSTTDMFDGTTWTTGGSLNVARSFVSGAGLATAALCPGGEIGGGSPITAGVEQYDGSTWSTIASLANARASIVTVGTASAALTAGGIDVTNSNASDVVEEYDGTTWTTQSSMDIPRVYHGGAGTVSAALMAAGMTTGWSALSSSSVYDGTTWTADASMAGNRVFAPGAGVKVAAIYSGGMNASFADSAVTEIYGGYISTPPTSTGQKSQVRFNDYLGQFQGHDGSNWTGLGGGALPVVNNSFVPNGVWSAGATLVYGTVEGAAGGSTTAAWTATGTYSAGDTQNYDGIAWATGGSVNYPRHYAPGCGPLTAGLMVAGIMDPGGYQQYVESYDGTTWTIEANYPDNEYLHSACGSAAGALVTAGAIWGVHSHLYDGATWSSTGSLITARFQAGIAGTPYAAIITGGWDSGASAQTDTTEHFDGSTWSSAAPISSPRGQFGMSGAPAAALASCGLEDSTSTVLSGSEWYDGTTWAANSNTGTARYGNYGVGAGNALSIGGFIGTETSMDEYTQAGLPVPTTGAVGQIRFNNEIGLVEVHNGIEWKKLKFV